MYNNMILCVSLNMQGSRTPESIRNKRKRYRAKKKQLHRENVATSQGSINNEHHLGNFQIDMSEIPGTPKSNECSQDKATDFDTSQLPDTPISGECRVNRPTEKPQLPDIPISINCKPSSHLPDTPISEASILNEQSSSDSSSSNWSRGPGSDCWDIVLDEAERFRQQQSRKRAELDMIYGAFSDRVWRVWPHVLYRISYLSIRGYQRLDIKLWKFANIKILIAGPTYSILA